MLDVVSVDNMRLSDAATINGGIPSLELMRRAGVGIFQSHNWTGKTAIVVGSGNNGGDGFALACELKRTGKDVTILTVTDHYSPDSSYYRQEALKLGIQELEFAPGNNMLCGYDNIVDCLLGTGFKGEVRGIYKDAIEEINSSNAFIISADINSGLDGDTGKANLAVISDLTVTIGLLKDGLIKEESKAFIKELVLADIGIPPIAPGNKLCSSSRWEYDSDSSEVVTSDGVIYKGDVRVITVR